MARHAAVSSGGRSVGAPCHASACPCLGRREQDCAGPRGPGVSFSRSFCSCGLLCDHWGAWGLCGFPGCLFRCLSRATVSGVLMGGGSRGLSWGC